METRKVWLYFQRLHALMHGLAVTPTHKTSAISASMISDNESRRLQSHEGRARSTTRTESGPLCHGRRLLSVTARPVLTGALVARNPSIVCTGGTAPTLVAQAAGTRHGYAPAAFPAIARPHAKGIMSSMIARATSGPMMGKAASKYRPKADRVRSAIIVFLPGIADCVTRSELPRSPNQDRRNYLLIPDDVSMNRQTRSDRNSWGFQSLPRPVMPFGCRSSMSQGGPMPPLLR
jgi:hypothetical protein